MILILRVAVLFLFGVSGYFWGLRYGYIITAIILGALSGPYHYIFGPHTEEGKCRHHHRRNYRHCSRDILRELFLFL